MTDLVLSGPTMTSLQIAEATGKLHKDVLRAIRSMEPSWEKINGRKFALVDYCDAKGETRPCYNLTKTECLYVATKFNDEARARLILRWEELEKERSAAKREPESARTLPPPPLKISRLRRHNSSRWWTERPSRPRGSWPRFWGASTTASSTPSGTIST